MKSKHPWKAKLIVGFLMLILAFLGLIISDLHVDGGWVYWRWIVLIYAILALGLSMYIRRSHDAVSPITLFHEILHWFGVVSSVFVVTFLVNHGVVSRFDAGIFDLLIMGLGVFLAGVYVETTFLVVGVVLAFMAIITGLLVQYLYAVMIPLFILALVTLGFIVWRHHQKATK